MRGRRRKPADPLEEAKLVRLAHHVERQTEAAAAVAGAATVDDARHPSLEVEPTDLAARSLKADEEALAREDALAGEDEDPFGREVERQARHEAEVTLADDLARQEDGAAKCAAMKGAGEDGAHREPR